MRSAPSIAFDYRPSATIGASIGVLTVAATAAPWSSALPLAARVVVSMAVLASSGLALGRFLRSDIRRIAYRAEGWLIVDASGVEHAAALAAHSRYGGWIALDFRLGGARRHRVLVGPANIGRETCRRLVLLLARADVMEAG